MPRLINEFQQFFDGSGEPLANGLLYFYESGSSSIAKETYLDSAESIANSNPVKLNGDGRCPNVFGSGVYNVIVRTSSGEQIQARDPVGGSSYLGFGSAWDALTVYSLSFVVFYRGKYWQSLISNNIGNQPESSETWMEIEFSDIKNNFADYAALEAIDTSLYSDGSTVTVTDEGIAGDFVLRNVVGHGLTSNGVVRVINADWYAYRLYNGDLHSSWFEITGDGTDEYSSILELHDYMLLTKQSCYFKEGIYDCGANNFPFRNVILSGITELKDYFGIRVYGAGKGKTIIRTTSADGKDVIQLNAIKRFRIDSLSVTAVLTGSSGAGSNGLSITNGGQDLDIDIDVYDCPSIDQGTFLDGGKAFTLQSNSGSILPYSNIKIRGKATNCGYAVGMDLPYEKFAASDSGKVKDVDIDVVAEDCWRGVVLSAAASTVGLSGEDSDCNMKVKATLINCAQSVSLGRWVRSSIDAHIITTKLKADLFRPFAADQAVYAANISGNYRSNVKIVGRMEECDNKLIIGGTTQGAGTFGGTDGINLDFEIDCPSTLGDEIDVVNAGGNTVKNSNIVFRGVTDNTGTDMILLSNRVVFDTRAELGTMACQDFSVPRAGAAWDAVKITNDFDGIQIPRTGSGSAGSPDGFAVIRDTISGISYKVQLYT